MKIRDPVCGMELEPSTAAETREFKGKTFYFCSPSCAGKFDSDPDKYAGGAGEEHKAHAENGHHAEHDHRGHAPHEGDEAMAHAEQRSLGSDTVLLVKSPPGALDRTRRFCRSHGQSVATSSLRRFALPSPASPSPSSGGRSPSPPD